MAQDILGALKHCELFRDLDGKTLAAVAEKAKWVEIPSGTIVYRAGEEGDALHLIANGRVSVSFTNEHGLEQVAAHLGRYEIVGELAVLTGEPRSATVRAVRDSAFVRISKADYEALLGNHPTAMFKVARQMVLRLRRPRTARARDAVTSTRTLAVIPAHVGLDVQGFAQELTTVLNNHGASLRLDVAGVDAALGAGAATSPFGSQGGGRGVYRWLNGLEAQYRYLVYQANPEADAWTRRCLRQADRILLLARASEEPQFSAMLALLRDEQILAPVELILLNDGNGPPQGSTTAWMDLTQAVFHHHIRGEPVAATLSPLARRVTGRALGLVLGSGGARGFAHLGLIRALHERNLPVDLVGGTSIGALIACLYASDPDYEALAAQMRLLFVDHNNLNDFSLSRVSLIRASKLYRRLEEIFGNSCIEDLPLPSFCVSTNLSRSRAMIHRRGRLVDWIGASMSVPGIAPPIVWQGDLLVDGALINSVPTDVMAALGRGPVLASDVSSDEEMRMRENNEKPYQLQRSPGDDHNFNLFNILFQTAVMTGEEVTAARVRSADLYLRMPVRDVGMFDWQKIETIIFRGYHHASEMLDTALADGTLRI